jgi:hypothetical protein
MAPFCDTAGAAIDPWIGAAEGDVRGDRPVLRHPDLPVERQRERRHVAHPDPPHAAALDPGGRLHRTDGGVDPDDGVRFRRGQAAGFQERRDGAHQGGARHRPEAALLEDDDADVGGGVQRRQDDPAWIWSRLVPSGSVIDRRNAP